MNCPEASISGNAELISKEVITFALFEFHLNFYSNSWKAIAYNLNIILNGG
ncbi:MAG: hypothetical protein ACHBN1_26285 [Heteroscytonema crispum UTEX LB 1556]